MPDAVSDLRLSAETATRMLLSAAGEILAHQDLLTKLDSAIGDGDHGTTMGRAAREAIDKLRETRPASAAEAFLLVADVFLNLDGGAAGPLFGTFLEGMARELPESAGAAGFARAAAAGLSALRGLTKAAPGDKTLVDALTAASEALWAASGGDLGAALEAAGEAAWRGAESTKDMVARAGRARHRGEASAGHQDAGATSAALLFRGFAAAFTGTERTIDG